MREVTRIIGIDPGSRCTGYGIIDSDGYQHKYVASGFIKVDDDDLTQRLKQIFLQLTTVVTNWQPQSAGIEQVFVNKNVDSALKLGQARGAAICAVVQADIDVGEYSARAIKKAVVGSGSAGKQQIQQMMKIIFKLSALPQNDEADGLAIAVCHANHLTFKNKGLAIRSRGGRWR